LDDAHGNARLRVFVLTHKQEQRGVDEQESQPQRKNYRIINRKRETAEDYGNQRRHAHGESRANGEADPAYRAAFFRGQQLEDQRCVEHVV
jgi:hypothetical protein